MIVLKPGQADEWIEAAKAMGEPLVIVVGARVTGHFVDSETMERVKEIVSAPRE